ncbi:redoxin domain-containing protein [Fimbriimonas ginsengisoli]|uniref:Thiol-disulfide isomerase-like thioredoxin n=1 Tax=Fimbriimonas ginsengisoli Gsoil 348 TaxID=661478 RepID=A0A068NXJ5_FIMGI|nr:redoxin domain-containing protein [Fimbriimonas ginsengisoli]AIE86359.1 thiol-disulfide isomerase-like thioredoxin [Fimbriimonas ginsengisoli Gsoil 348]
MINLRLLALSGLIPAAAGAHAGAGVRTYLNIGDPAPSIAGVKWLKGVPITSFKKGDVYVVEFWATWCGPCKENIPHLTELAKKYKGAASIVGISIWESNDPTSSAYLDKVEAFVKSQGDRMDYNVGADGPEGKVGKEWMRAADENGIPTSFIVGKDGKIAWIGHPANMEAVLTQVIDGKFDVAAARSRRATDVETTRPIRESMAAKNYGKALKLIDAAVAKKPDQERFYTYDRLVAQYHVAPKDAMVASEKILEQSNGEIGAYRMIVSIFASQKDLTPSVYRYGKKLAEKALEKGEMKYMFLAMSAEVSSSLGEFSEAVKSQEEAVTAAESDTHAPAEFVQFLKKKLDEFRAQAKKAKAL